MQVEDKSVYDDNKTLRECKIEDKDVVALVYKIDQARHTACYRNCRAALFRSSRRC
jgi:hypothetical protein